MYTEEQLKKMLRKLDKELMEGESLESDKVNKLVIKIRLLREILQVQEMNWTTWISRSRVSAPTSKKQNILSMIYTAIDMDR